MITLLKTHREYLCCHYKRLYFTVFIVRYLVYSSALDAKWVLINLNYLPVLQNGLVFRSDGPQVHAHQERRSQNGPNCELRFTLFV